VPKVLTPKQLNRAKFSLGCIAALASLNIVTYVSGEYFYDDREFEQMGLTTFPRGQIVEFTNLDEFCSR